jgi:hypothetical protein
MKIDIAGIISTLLQDKTQIGLALLLLVGAASMLAKGLEKLTAGLVVYFPKLKTLDGDLIGVAAFFDALAKNRFLNWLAASPAQPAPAAAKQTMPPTLKPAGFASIGFAWYGMVLTLILMALVFACAHLTPVETQLVDCGEAAVMNQITSGSPSIVSQVSSILSSGDVNWQASLDTLLSVAGPAVVCAVEAVVSDLEHSSGKNQVQSVAMVRGDTWVASEGHVKLVKPPAAAK